MFTLANAIEATTDLFLRQLPQHVRSGAFGNKLPADVWAQITARSDPREQSTSDTSVPFVALTSPRTVGFLMSGRTYETKMF